MGTLTREGFEKLIREDIEWLKKNTAPQSLERAHIIAILERSTGLYYDKMPEGFRQWVEAERSEN